MTLEKKAPRASYRVPTRDEMQRLVDSITGEILAGKRVLHWKSDNALRCTGITLLDHSDEFLIHHWDSCELRHADHLCRDSFQVAATNETPAADIVPAWLERGSL